MKRPKAPEKLILGHWRSDRKRTVAQWVWPKRLAVERRRWFESIFGKQRRHYTPTRLTTTNGRQVSSGRYRVLWSRSGPVFPQLVLVHENSDGEEAQQIFFDSPDSFYIQGGKCAEFFRRIQPRVRSKKQRGAKPRVA
jgi:hypothetical protein